MYVIMIIMLYLFLLYEYVLEKTKLDHCLVQVWSEESINCAQVLIVLWLYRLGCVCADLDEIT